VPLEQQVIQWATVPQVRYRQVHFERTSNNCFHVTSSMGSRKEGHAILCWP
jgi:hypothetical protein